jgi:hypothetical protein
MHTMTVYCTSIHVGAPPWGTSLSSLTKFALLLVKGLLAQLSYLSENWSLHHSSDCRQQLWWANFKGGVEWDHQIDFFNSKWYSTVVTLFSIILFGYLWCTVWTPTMRESQHFATSESSVELQINSWNKYQEFLNLNENLGGHRKN